MTHSPSDEFRRELESAKLRALAEFAAGAGHEINNPVATIVGYVQQLLAEETDPDRRHALATIGGQAYRIRDMIGDVMLFARPPTPRPVLVELTSTCREIAGQFAGEAEAVGCEIIVEPGAPFSVFADPVQFRVAVGALIRNGVEATLERGRIRVVVSSVDDGGKSLGVVQVADNGRGLSEIDREHLFDPFYSGRQAGRGLGFGLSKAWRIVTMHGGRIEVDSAESRGATFTLFWPATAADSA